MAFPEEHTGVHGCSHSCWDVDGEVELKVELVIEEGFRFRWVLLFKVRTACCSGVDGGVFVGFLGMVFMSV